MHTTIDVESISGNLEQMRAFINVPDTIRRTAPSEVGARAIYLEGFDDGSGFVFNPESPKGVVYLAAHAYSLYRGLLDETGRPPVVDPLNGAFYKDLVSTGLAISSGPATTTVPRAKPNQFSVWFHISNACNLSCQYCYIPKLEKAADLDSLGPQFMSPSTIELSTRSLLDFCSVSGHKKLNIKFAGGEPTLNVKRLVEACECAIRLAQGYGVHVSFSMLSNGVFTDESIFEFIKSFRVGLGISLDGAPNEHDRVRFTINHREVRAPGKKRQRHGTWEIIAANIERLRAMGSSPFILCTVTPSNHRTLRQLLDATIGWGVGMRLSLVRDQRSHALPGMVESILAELADLYAWLGERMPVDMPIDRFAGFAEWSPSVKKNGVCSACRNSSALDQDGNVASCQMRMDHPWGNTTAETFSDIFERMSSAEDNRYLSRPETRTGGCSVCYWKHVCAGGCPEHTRLAEGSQNVPSPWCSVYRELLPHYLRAIAVQMKRRAEPIVPALYADKK